MPAQHHVITLGVAKRIHGSDLNIFILIVDQKKINKNMLLVVWGVENSSQNALSL